MRLTLFLLLATLGRAEESCPWLNAATAGGLLDGTVQATYAKGECNFTNTNGDLTITVSPSTGVLKKPVGCEALKAIGNEAYLCSTTTEQVTGRVRDSIFVVRLRSSNKDRSKLINIAEQVAGSLF